MHTPAPLETERRNRIRLSLFAYAYEFESESLVSDAVFDELARRIDPSVSTGHEVLDAFFRDKFDPDTGVWVWDHPELEKVAKLYDKLEKKRPFVLAPPAEDDYSDLV